MAQLNRNTDLASLLVGMLPSPLQDSIDITGLTLDSRQVEQGNAFIALAQEGEQRLAHIEQGVASGCKAILFDRQFALTDKENELIEQAQIDSVAVSTLANRVSEIAGRFYGHPSLALKVIAITGTNGKTSVSQFIAQCLENMGQPCGVIGTLGVGRINQLVDTGMTTPDPVTIQAILAEFCQQSIPYVVIEASSHALEQGRLNDIAIDIAVLTNLSRDHLDYHQDFASYAAAKKQLFDFASLNTAVINSSDDFGKTLITALEQRNDITVMSYSSKQPAMVGGKDIATTHAGLSFSVQYAEVEQSIHSPLLGRFNVDNLLATLTSLLTVGVEFDQATALVEQCHSVQGRMQVYGGDKQAQIVIDFAHTPDALTQALASLHEHTSTTGQVWCVFGCGGDRDVGKRPLMGQSAERYADQVVLTSDNPRSEDNSAIVTQILQGIEQPDAVYIEHDRTKAIRHAISHAADEDIVLVAGKGHEIYQEIAGVKYPYSDEQTVLTALADFNATATGAIQ